MNRQVAETAFIPELSFCTAQWSLRREVAAATVSVDAIAMTEEENFKKNDTSGVHSDMKQGENNGGSTYSGHKIRYPNPPESSNPDMVTLAEQWRFATRKFSRWYSRAWGTAVLAGASLLVVGWFIKGSNPLPSFNQPNHPPSSPPSDADDKVR